MLYYVTDHYTIYLATWCFEISECFSCKLLQQALRVEKRKGDGTGSVNTMQRYSPASLALCDARVTPFHLAPAPASIVKRYEKHPLCWIKIAQCSLD